MATFGPYHAHGIMPLGSDRQDQPATWIEAATFMETALADYRDADRQEAKAKRRAQQPGTAKAR